MDRFFYQNYLFDEISRRTARNSRYSMRAFAKTIGIDVAALSRILSGQTIPSVRTVEQIFANVRIDAQHQKQFYSSISEAHQARGSLRMDPRLRLLSGKRKTIDQSIDTFRAVSNWYHAAILELTFVTGFKNDPKWISGQLGISPTEAKLAVERLVRIGLLKIVDGRLAKADRRITTADKHATSIALRRVQREVLERSIASLEHDPIEDRSHTSMTMAIDPANLAVAKRLIEDFTQILCDTLESGLPSRVYNLGVSLYPVQKKSNIRIQRVNHNQRIRKESES